MKWYPLTDYAEIMVFHLLPFRRRRAEQRAPCKNQIGPLQIFLLIHQKIMNLLEPGDTPNENIQFLLVLACIMKAVDTHADLLRQSASDVGNDHRLGSATHSSE